MPRFFPHSLLDWTICVMSNKQLLIHFYCVSQGYAFLHHMILWVHVSDKTSFFGCPIFSSMFPKSTHETLSQKLYEKFKNHKRFAKPKLSRTAFTIQHYAGDVSIFNIIMTLCLCICLTESVILIYPQVTYQSDHFLDKNKDYVVAEHAELLNASRCSFVSVLFPPATEENTKSSKSSSIATRFKVTFCYS
jgi:hypothetical protein